MIKYIFNEKYLIRQRSLEWEIQYGREEGRIKRTNRNIKKIRKDAGMNRREFSDYMGIPLRTLEEWESGRRKMPDYVLRLITYHTKMELFLKKKGITYEET